MTHEEAKKLKWGDFILVDGISREITFSGDGMFIFFAGTIGRIKLRTCTYEEAAIPTDLIKALL